MIAEPPHPPRRKRGTGRKGRTPFSCFVSSSSERKMGVDKLTYYSHPLQLSSHYASKERAEVTS